ASILANLAPLKLGCPFTGPFRALSGSARHPSGGRFARLTVAARGPRYAAIHQPLSIATRREDMSDRSAAPRARLATRPREGAKPASANAEGHPVRVDLGCGDGKQDGFIGIDRFALP